MRVLLTGAAGQLGRASLRCATAAGHDVIPADVAELDITNAEAVDKALRDHAPDLLLNAAAFTAVDKAEEQRELAFAVNEAGARNLARASENHRVRMLHVSTDYVFDGTATSPYSVSAPMAPLGVYGASKAAGEAHVLEHGGTVVRTSWLFEEGGPSFVHTMLRLAQERRVLRVVGDQVGCPTWADDLAAALLPLANQPAGIYHYCNDGISTWHGFASEIVDEARKHRTLMCEQVEAITTAEYPTPARRPAYSVLDTQSVRDVGIEPPSWRRGMAHVVAKVLRG